MAERARVFDPKAPPQYEVLQDKVIEAIKHEFLVKRERPELLNRIGDNIVVFDFIRPSAAREIFEMMIENVRTRIYDEHGITLEVPDDARRMLFKWCTDDLADGGRGIGNRLEATFINPLARALFDAPLSERHTFAVRRVTDEGSNYSVELA